MNKENINDLISELKQSIDWCKRLLKQSSKVIQPRLEGEIRAYEDCIEKLEKLNK